MVGQIRLKFIRTGIPEEPGDDYTDEDDGLEEQWWTYNTTGFHWLKGQVLRGGIAYLEQLHTSAREKEASPEGAKQFFLDAGIKAVVNAKDDTTAAKGASVVIRRALDLLNEWKREQRGTDRLSMLTSFGGRFPFPGGPGANLEDILDSPYHVMKIMDLLECPIALERAGMRGMYFIMHMSDNSQLIYSEEAQMMASMVDRIFPAATAALEGGDKSDFEDLATQFSQFMKECKEGMYIEG